MPCPIALISFFFFNDTATTEIYTLSLHDALPISPSRARAPRDPRDLGRAGHRSVAAQGRWARVHGRSEEHTSELQSPCNLVCRLLLEKKKKKHTYVLLAIAYTSKMSAGSHLASTR